jgi:predicted nucleic acid-binding protein
LELSSTEVLLHLEKFETIFSLRPDNPEVYHEWKNLVSQHKAMGKPSHDARIAAAMKVHAVTHLLTFNTDDFKRFTDVISVNPFDV